ncbi:MAG TPA: thioredoxin domain-containing protein [Silvibacterium sp.]|nr:thioredoxin domain-containing protein [Silvibacterium sp.]
MFRNRFSQGLCLVLLAAFVAVGCRAQNPPAATAPAKPLDLKITRNIEVTLRSRLNIPPDYVIHVGPRTSSNTPGFDNLLVSFDLPQHPEHSQKLTFLISDDNKTLERIARWDISADAASLVPAGDRPVRGNPNAKVVLVNFDDLECPFCAKLHSELFPETLSHYKGLIKIVYRDMPLEELHPWAMHAAVDANCLAAQSGEAYWNYVDYLHTHGEDITGPDRDPKKSAAMLDKDAVEQGPKYKLDATKLSACVAKQDETVVRDEMKLAESLEIEQTPTMYINGEVISGALPEGVLWRAIDRALASEGVTPPPNPYDAPAKPIATAAEKTSTKR